MKAEHLIVPFFILLRLLSKDVCSYVTGLDQR